LGGENHLAMFGGGKENFGKETHETQSEVRGGVGQIYSEKGEKGEKEKDRRTDKGLKKLRAKAWHMSKANRLSRDHPKGKKFEVHEGKTSRMSKKGKQNPQPSTL